MINRRQLRTALAGCGKICCLPRAENCPTINAVLSRVLNALFELDYHMPNAAETVEAPYTAAERLTFLPQPASPLGGIIAGALCTAILCALGGVLW